MSTKAVTLLYKVITAQLYTCWVILNGSVLTTECAHEQTARCKWRVAVHRALLTLCDACMFAQQQYCKGCQWTCEVVNCNAVLVPLITHYLIQLQLRRCVLFHEWCTLWSIIAYNTCSATLVTVVKAFLLVTTHKRYQCYTAVELAVFRIYASSTSLQHRTVERQCVWPWHTLSCSNSQCSIVIMPCVLAAC